MRIDRRVVRRKDQYLLAIPAQVRKHLGVVAGSRVWWHIAQKGACAVSNTGRVIRGRLKLDADCPSCAGYRHELERLQAKLQAQPQRIWHQFRTQEALRKMSLDLRGYPALDAINDRLRGIEERLGTLPPEVRTPSRRRLRDVLAPFADEVSANLRKRPRHRPGAVRAIEDHVNGCATCLRALVDKAPGAAPCAFYDQLLIAVEAQRKPTRRGAAPHVQSPALSDPPAVVEEGADTPGAQLPGVPLET